MDETVDRGDRHGGIGEDVVPLAKGPVGGDQQALALVAGGDELEQHAGLGLVLAGIAEVVEDDEVEPVELGDRGLEREVATGSLEPLDEVGGAGEQDPVAVLDQGVAEGPGAVTLPATRWAEDQQIGTFSSQVSPAARALRCALLSIGTAVKSKLSKVLPGGR